MIPAGMTSRQAIVAAAREALGTPFHHQGRVVGVGIDCVGLLVHVADRLGLPREDVAVYSMTPKGRQLEKILAFSLEQIDPAVATAGDVLCFWIRRVGRPQHVAILSDGGKMIHTFADVRKVVEHDFAPPWPGRVSSAWRYPGVD